MMVIFYLFISIDYILIFVYIILIDCIIIYLFQSTPFHFHLFSV